MDNSAEYWRRAQAAYERARQATNEENKAAWLRIAKGFETLFRLVERGEAARATGDGDPDDARGLLH